MKVVKWNLIVCSIVGPLKLPSVISGDFYHKLSQGTEARKPYHLS